jgi:hypothetical protein
MTAARESLVAERAVMLLEAPVIDDDYYIELDGKASRGAHMTKEERIIYERNHFERTVGVSLDEHLVEMNTDGRLLDKVKTLAAVLPLLSTGGPGRGLVDALLEPTTKPRGRLQKQEPEVILAVLMTVADLADGGGIKAQSIVSVDTLAKFVAICRGNRTMIEEVFREPMRNDFQKNPTRQMNAFLKHIGLELTVADTRKMADRKIRYYAISADPLAAMTRLAISYREAEGKRAEEKEMSPRRRSKRAERAQIDEPSSAEEKHLLSRSILGC